jgi:hypothetical protein
MQSVPGSSGGCSLGRFDIGLPGERFSPRRCSHRRCFAHG